MKGAQESRDTGAAPLDKGHGLLFGASFWCSSTDVELWFVRFSRPPHHNEQGKKGEGGTQSAPHTLCSGPTSRVKGANANQLILLEVSTKGNSVP